ncbi:integrase [Undibacterium terreum]|uniref:Integrase n=2 Tax=Undibacterium terreum TaxID=1224302 RepID=A0A916V0B7_9BURK|nr:integrase [Undibacterium terreum]
MLRRTKILKSGKVWIAYYYNGRDDNGDRQEIPLGTDLNEAKRKWAELECKEPPPDTRMMKTIFDRYEAQIIPKKGINTQSENLGALKQLRIAFNDAPIDAITPYVIAQYRDRRTAKVRANREISLLSHIYNHAREWGYTTKENPTTGVKKNKEIPRDYYADPEVWEAVYAVACEELRDAMDINYLTGQRPADVLKMTEHDVKPESLHVKQNKSNKILRILLESNGEKSLLSEKLTEIRGRSRKVKSMHLIATPKGRHLTKKMLRDRFVKARKTAADIAEIAGDTLLAPRIRAFQFRDIRPKAASEIDDLTDASRLLGHTKEEITKIVYRRVGEKVKPTK